MALSPMSALERVTDSSQTLRHFRKVPTSEVMALLVTARTANDVRASIRRKFHVKAEGSCLPKLRLLTDARVDARASRLVIGSGIPLRGRHRGRTSRPDRERRR